MEITGLLKQNLTAVLLVALAGCAVLAKADNGAIPGEREPITFGMLQKQFSKPDMKYAPYAFWFWDAPLDPKQAARMAEAMCAQGFNPGYAHPRTGLPANEWLSPLWFESLNAAYEKTKAAGCYMGWCDEYNWPSGQANGRVLAAHPELSAQSLHWETKDCQGGEVLNLPASLFTVVARKDSQGRVLSSTLRIIGGGKPFSVKLPAGAWRTYTFTAFNHAGIDGSPVNYLDDRLMKAFMPIAYEPYERFLKGKTGNTLSGIFVDNEGDYGWKLAWSDHLAQYYKKKTGRDIRLWMPLLIDRDAEGIWVKARWEWLDSVSDIYSANFFGQINKWCADRGLTCTMHLWEESLLLQAEAVGDYFKAMRAVAIPGTDSLMRKPLEPMEFKEAQSVSEFENRRCTCEVLGVVGWDMTPVLLRQTTNAVTAWGVSHMIPHGVYMRKDLNTIPYPPDFFAENPYWPYLHLWTDYTRRASFITSHGKTVPDTLLLNPMDSLWATTGEWLFAQQPDIVNLVQHINSVYFDALKRLTDARIEFLVADRHYLQQMNAEDGRLKLDDYVFKTVVVPPVFALPLSVMEKLTEFAKGGGSVILLGELPVASTDNGYGDPRMTSLVADLKSLPSVKFCGGGLSRELETTGTALRSQSSILEGSFTLIQSHMRIDGRDFFWLANNGADQHDVSMLFYDMRGPAAIWNCETGRSTPIPSDISANGSRVKLHFGPYEGYYVVFDPSKQHTATSGVTTQPATNVINIQGKWLVQVPKQGQPTYTPDTAPEFTIGWKGRWLAPTRAMRFRRSFELGEAPRTALFEASCDGELTAIINGHVVANRNYPGIWQIASVTDVASYLKKGRNVIALRCAPNGGTGLAIFQLTASMPDGSSVTIKSDPDWRTEPDNSSEDEPPFGQWIWSTSTRDNQKVYFRHAFEIPAQSKVLRATMLMTADNRFTLILNGKKVGSGEPWMEPVRFDLAPLLKAGRNTIAVEAGNDDGAAGLLGGLSIQCRNGERTRIMTGGDWVCAEEPKGDWASPSYNDQRWQKVKVVAAYGDAPWGRFSLAGIGIVPQWAETDFDESAWSTANALVAETAPGNQIPPELLAGGSMELTSWTAMGLSRFTGYVDYSTTFEMKDNTASAVLDLGDVKYLAEVFVNGNTVGARLWPPFKFDISPLIKPGTNTLRIRVGNLATNEMGLFADKGLLSTWGWGPAPANEYFDAGLFGPVNIELAQRQ